MRLWFSITVLTIRAADAGSSGAYRALDEAGLFRRQPTVQSREVGHGGRGITKATTLPAASALYTTCQDLRSADCPPTQAPQESVCGNRHTQRTWDLTRPLDGTL